MSERFGTMPDGAAVTRVTLQGGGLSANVLTYGAVIQDLRLEGHDAPLVLGFSEFAPYLTHSPYFGAIAGRYANRIRDGHLEIDGQTFQLDTNFLGKHLLHGGSEGVGRKNWQITSVSESSVTLEITVSDGHMGFPGNLASRVTYSLLEGGVLDVAICAETDATTLCNLAHHSYFNLSGQDGISDHELWVDADIYLPVDDELIPTGERALVAGTSFDFRHPKPVSQAHPVDHNFCISAARGSLRHVARLYGPTSGIALDCLTTEPGLQVYDGARIDIDLPGLQGKPMGRHAGIALEPQIWPDANHHDDFPSALLRPGETYAQHTRYAFSRTE